MSIDFFGDWNLNRWWKNKLAKLGYTIEKYKFGFTEGVCAICGNTDYIFPSGELRVCDKCYRHMLDNNAIITSHSVEVNLHGEYCDVCGERMYKIHRVQTYICNKCTRKIGKQAKENREKYMYKFNARKIA